MTRALLLLAVLLGVTFVDTPAAEAAPRQEAVVVLGDSAASGEGAGDYVPGTRGEGGDWCHRSPHAYAYATGLAPVAVDLACSGAHAADVAFGGSHDGEPSQATRLAQVARRYRVTTVVVQLGANDAAALIATGVVCIRAFLDIAEPPCRQTLGPLVPARMSATASVAETAVRDVKTAMRQAGYRDGGYALVLASYAAPITEHMIALPGLRGCPYSRADAAWGRTALFPALSAALRGVADRTGAAFLDLDRATEGREACSREDAGEEWQRRITVDPEAIVYGGLDALSYHLAQESFHPSAAAHRAIGACLGTFVRSRAEEGSCVPDGAGLRLETGPPPVP